MISEVFKFISTRIETVVATDTNIELVEGNYLLTSQGAECRILVTNEHILPSNKGHSIPRDRSMLLRIDKGQERLLYNLTVGGIFYVSRVELIHTDIIDAFRGLVQSLIPSFFKR